MMALPLMVLYEISIVGAKIFGKKKPSGNGNKESSNGEKMKEETSDEHE
jgi:Sec-independent protein secretion pathway component TatC